MAATHLKCYTVSRDDAIYDAWPDVALTPAGRPVCVFAECTHHADRGYTRMMFTVSDDRGRTWAPKEPASPAPAEQAKVAGQRAVG